MEIVTGFFVGCALALCFYSYFLTKENFVLKRQVEFLEKRNNEPLTKMSDSFIEAAQRAMEKMEKKIEEKNKEI